MTTEDMVQQAMTLPTGTAVAGRNVSLLDVLGQVTDRSKRLEITHAYWRLVKLLGEYRFCWEESQQIQSIGLGTIDANLLGSAQQAADREVTAMELAVINAQYELAEVAGLEVSGQLPLPADRPHIGTYNTFFEQIFADSTPPGQTRLLHRTLPLQHQVIGVRAEAVQAAQEALQAVARSYQAGQVDAADLLAALHEITVQRRAWMTAVARYNHSIADYALAIAGPETAGRELVSILIKLSQADPQTGRGESGDFSAGMESGLEQQADTEPPRAFPWDGDESAKPGEPTLAAPRNQVTEITNSHGLPPEPLDPVEKSDPAVASATAEIPAMVGGKPAPDPAVTPAVAETSATDPSGDQVVRSRPMVAVEESDAAPREQTVFRQPGLASSASLERHHGDLVGLPAGVQAKRLTGDFHGGEEVVGLQTEGIDLETCLDGVPGAERHAVIQAYWEASHRVAESKVYRRHAEMLERLVESVTLGAAGTNDARARLKAAQLEARADLLDAETRLLATQHELTKRCGRPLDGSWLVPNTLPHAGDYRLNLESQPPQIVESWALKRLATLIPTLNRSLKDRAVAVVEADSRRAETVYAYQNQSLGFDRVLAAVDQQTQECLEFLNVLAAYNQSIADYVTAVVPKSLPEEQLVATLVVR
jgi:hypothetical protein